MRSYASMVLLLALGCGSPSAAPRFPERAGSKANTALGDPQAAPEPHKKHAPNPAPLEQREWERYESLLEADRLFSDGDFEKARVAYENALNEDPSQIPIWLRLGNAHAKAGRAWDAVAAFETAYRLGQNESVPTSQETALATERQARVAGALAKLWSVLGDPPRALEWNDRALSGTKNDSLRVQLRTQRFTVLAAAGREAEAEHEILVLLGERGPLDRTRLLRRLAELRLKQGKQEAAIRALKAAVDAGDPDPTLLTYLGRHLLERDQSEMAVGYLQQSLKRAPNETTHRLLVLAFIRAGNQSEASAELERYQSRYPDGPVVELVTALKRAF